MKREALRKGDDTPGKVAAHNKTATETQSTDLSELEKRIAALEAENADCEPRMKRYVARNQFTSSARNLQTKRGENSSILSRS